MLSRIQRCHWISMWNTWKTKFWLWSDYILMLKWLTNFVISNKFLIFSTRTDLKPQHLLYKKEEDQLFCLSGRKKKLEKELQVVKKWAFVQKIKKTVRHTVGTICATVRFVLWLKTKKVSFSSDTYPPNYLFFYKKSFRVLKAVQNLSCFFSLR